MKGCNGKAAFSRKHANMTQLSERTARSHTAGNSFLMGQVHLAQRGACSLASTSYDKICICSFKNSLYPKLEGLYAGGGLQVSLGKTANVLEFCFQKDLCCLCCHTAVSNSSPVRKTSHLPSLKARSVAPEWSFRMFVIKGEVLTKAFLSSLEKCSKAAGRQGKG